MSGGSMDYVCYTEKTLAEKAIRIYDDSDGTVDDIAHLTALNCHMTQAECEEFLELAVKREIAKLLKDEGVLR